MGVEHRPFSTSFRRQSFVGCQSHSNEWCVQKLKKKGTVGYHWVLRERPATLAQQLCGTTPLSRPIPPPPPAGDRHIRIPTVPTQHTLSHLPRQWDQDTMYHFVFNVVCTKTVQKWIGWKYNFLFHISHGSCRESSFPSLCSVTTELVFTNFTAFQIVQTCANKSQRREHSASELPAFSPRMQRKHENFSFCKKKQGNLHFLPLVPEQKLKNDAKQLGQ